MINIKNAASFLCFAQNYWFHLLLNCYRITSLHSPKVKDELSCAFHTYPWFPALPNCFPLTASAQPSVVVVVVILKYCWNTSEWIWRLSIPTTKKKQGRRSLSDPADAKYLLHSHLDVTCWGYMVVMWEPLESVYVSAWWCKVWVTPNLSSGWWDSISRLLFQGDNTV